MTDRKGFRITSGKGFHVTFANGWTVSVQFGGGNYCANRDAEIGGDEWESAGKGGCVDAEVAAWPEGGSLVPLDGDTVKGWQSPAKVLALMNVVAALPASATKIPAAELATLFPPDNDDD